MVPLENSEFGAHCDRLWRDWLQGSIQPGEACGLSLDLDSAPEPWLEFEGGSNPLFVATTNPGGSQSFQNIVAIQSRSSQAIRPLRAYADATRGLGEFYREWLGPRTAAGRRIRSMHSLSQQAGFRGLYQVEACPFHSVSFPDKAKFVHAVEGNVDSRLSKYAEALRDFLGSRNVVGVSAVSSLHGLDRSGVQKALEESVWLGWFAGLIGIDHEQADLVELTTRSLNDGGSKKVTSAALVQHQEGRVSGLVLMMGGNNLPGADGVRRLANALSR